MIIVSRRVCVAFMPRHILQDEVCTEQHLAAMKSESRIGRPDREAGVRSYRSLPPQQGGEDEGEDAPNGVFPELVGCRAFHAVVFLSVVNSQPAELRNGKAIACRSNQQGAIFEKYRCRVTVRESDPGRRR